MTLVDTKERALPMHDAQSSEDYLVYLKHVALYKFVAGLCQNKTVLDLGCGEGYGSAILAHTSDQVVAVDYSFEVVAHAHQEYVHKNLEFVVCDAQHLPFCRRAFDVLVSFEVIEHMPDVSKYLIEIKQVLKEKATVVISTPNRLLRLLPFQKPWNRFHMREYDYKSFRRVLNTLFEHIEMLGMTAVPPVLEIERRRVKQNPFVAYPKMLTQMLLPRSIYSLLKNAKLKTSSAGARKDSSATIFSENDFMLSNNILRECITLVAVCER